MQEILQKAKNASKIIANLKDNVRNEILNAMAEEILTQKELILQANAIDLNNANISKAMLERLRLDSAKIDLIANAIKDIANLKSPLNRIIDGWENYKGLKIQKITTPIGVIAMIYESRPNVTSDSAALCFKSGNVCILKGGKEALHSNKAIVKALHLALKKFDLPTEAICFIDNKEAVESLLKCDKYIDLVIPRGGESLIKFVTKHSTIPVIKHDKGVCHLYLHSDCPKDMAINIALNAKLSKPSACNSIECILAHKDFAFLKDVIEALKSHNVTILACENIAKKFHLKQANEADFYKEYNDNIINLKMVDSAKNAINHINKYGSSHSEAILTNDLKVAEIFTNEVDSACVFVNTSTRFCDGGEFGFGAEIGISTSKLHARGPMGIESLTSYKYKIIGNGEVR